MVVEKDLEISILDFEIIPKLIFRLRTFEKTFVLVDNASNISNVVIFDAVAFGIIWVRVVVKVDIICGVGSAEIKSELGQSRLFLSCKVIRGEFLQIIVKLVNEWDSVRFHKLGEVFLDVGISCVGIESVSIVESNINSSIEAICSIRLKLHLGEEDVGGAHD
jgi:hypothetical protein